MKIEVRIIQIIKYSNFTPSWYMEFVSKTVIDKMICEKWH